MGPSPDRASGDEWSDRLARLFRDHPAWMAAAAYLRPEATSTVYFAHRPGEPWRLERSGNTIRLLPGAAVDPDLVFRFSKESIEALEAVEGGIGDFAVELFSLVTADRVALRVVARFIRLGRRGYVRLILAAGPKVVAFGVSHGIRDLGALRRFVAELRTQGPASWECEDAHNKPEEP